MKKCPYCGNKLDKKPTRKKKCPHCDRYIFIRNGELKTEDESIFIDFTKRVQWLDINVSDMKREQNKLRKKKGKESSAYDTVRSIISNSIRKASSDDKFQLNLELERIDNLERQVQDQMNFDSLLEQQVCICPYCGKVVKEKPKRAKKCPHCKKKIHIIHGEYVTDADAELRMWANYFHYLDLSYADFKNEQNILTKRFGTTASVHDTIWKILNSSLRPDDYGRNARIYNDMVYILRLEGRNTKFLKAEALKQDLLGYKEEVRRDTIRLERIDAPYKYEYYVRIHNTHAKDVCGKCRALRREKFTIEEALEQMPIPGECENENGCRCSYSLERDIVD
jgi:rubrerythrin